jgi:hypothetical protein
MSTLSAINPGGHGNKTATSPFGSAKRHIFGLDDPVSGPLSEVRASDNILGSSAALKRAGMRLEAKTSGFENGN